MCLPFVLFSMGSVQVIMLNVPSAGIFANPFETQQPGALLPESMPQPSSTPMSHALSVFLVSIQEENFNA